VGGRGSTDRWGHDVSVSVKKKKGRGRGGPVLENRWAAWAKKGAGAGFFFFFSLFQTPFSNQIHFKFKSNLSNFFSRIL
jgi:hypothetical protein